MSKEDKLLTLPEALATYFNVAELKSLSARLGIPYDELPDTGGTRSGMARELIAYVQRRDGGLEALTTAAGQARSQLNIDWAALPLYETNIGGKPMRHSPLVWGLVATVVILFIALTGFWLMRPSLSQQQNESGLQHHANNDYAQAKASYQRAIWLDSDNLAAHYNLGLLYEDTQDFSAAQAAYTIAAEGGLDAAINNLARLYILADDPAAAVSWLQRGLDIVADDSARYDMLKNMGWARYQQERYPEAEVHLLEAIALQNDKGAAHCLLALVQEAQDGPEVALPEWEKCLQYADGRNPDEDEWLNMARGAVRIIKTME